MKRTPFPISLLFLLVFIAMVNGLSNTFSWYFYAPWLDIPMHFLGGVFIAGVALWLYFSRIKEHDEHVSVGRTYGVALFATIIIGILWEVFEFGLDIVVVFSPLYDIADTLGDLFFDIVGALVAVYIFLSRKV